VDLVGNAYRAFFRMNRHSIHLLERHGLESDIFVLMENQGTWFDEACIKLWRLIVLLWWYSNNGCEWVGYLDLTFTWLCT
jgi:hypothetical protein